MGRISTCESFELMEIGCCLIELIREKKNEKYFDRISDILTHWWNQGHNFEDWFKALENAINRENYRSFSLFFKIFDCDGIIDDKRREAAEQIKTFESSDGKEYFCTGNFIGKGSYAEVFTAYDVENDRIVVLKKIDLSVYGDKMRTIYEEMILREINLLNRCVDLEKIIKLYAHLSDPRNCIYYYVMEYCPYGNLSQFISDHTVDSRLNKSWVYKIMREIREALKVFRTLEITHRDIKPDNILVSAMNEYDIELKFCDFTFARVLIEGQFTGSLLGTQRYIAPEVYQTRSHTSSVDLYSVGVIFGELLELAGEDLSDIEIDLLNGLRAKKPLDRISYHNYFNHAYFKQHHKSKASIINQQANFIKMMFPFVSEDELDIHLKYKNQMLELHETIEDLTNRNEYLETQIKNLQNNQKLNK